MTVVGAAEFLSAHLPADRAALLAARLDRLPDPTEAMRALERLATAGAFPADLHRADAVLTLADCSPYLGRLIVQHPDFLDAVQSGDAGRGLPDREDLEGEWSRFRGQHAPGSLHSVLRLFKQRALLRIALADLLRTADLSQVTRALSTLADFALRQAVAAARAPLEAKTRGADLSATIGATWRPRDSSFWRSGSSAARSSTTAATSTSSTCSPATARLPVAAPRARASSGTGSTSCARLPRRPASIGGVDADGEVFRVDLNLRPGGRDGDLVTSIAAAVAYYRTWAEPWSARRS